MPDKKKLAAMLSNGATKTSGFADLPSSELQASSLTKHNKNRRKKKKEIADQYFLPAGSEDTFMNQADSYRTLLDESRRNKMLGLFDPSKYTYNDLLPLIQGNVGENLTPGVQSIFNDVRSAMLGATEYPVPFPVKSDPNSNQFKSSMRREVGLNLSPLTPFPLLRMGDIPDYQDMAANNYGGSVDLWEKDSEGNNVPLSGSWIHTHNTNENMLENHGNDINVAEEYSPGTQNFTVDNKGAVEYDAKGLRRRYSKNGGLLSRRKTKFANALFDPSLE